VQGALLVLEISVRFHLTGLELRLGWSVCVSDLFFFVAFFLLLFREAESASQKKSALALSLLQLSRSERELFLKEPQADNDPIPGLTLLAASVGALREKAAKLAAATRAPAPSTDKQTVPTAPGETLGPKLPGNMLELSD
jgi:hypothetical protein